MIKVLSTNISEKKGTIKKPVEFISLDENGISGDAHSGPWNRMVSMLGIESIRRFEEAAQRKIGFGEFAENITTEGMEMMNTVPLDRFVFDKVILEVTQIGKSCHGDGCTIFREVGNCVMPKEGIFCRVLQSGTLKTGDVAEYQPRVFKILVITLSDRASQGVYNDLSGPEVTGQLKSYLDSKKRFYEIKNEIIPDDAAQLESILRNAIPTHDFIFTTGGTGIGPRDITPDVVKFLIDKEITGIMEHIRTKYGADRPNALISRGVAGISENCFIFTLPGSVNAVKEYMNEILKLLVHLVYMRYSIDSH